jgi:alpha-L-fucosidase 2
MMYWQALRGGMPETLLPLFDLLDRWKDDFRTNARRLWGCRGLVLPLYMGDRGGLKGDFQPHCVYWTGAGAWIASFHWDYWLWTGDRAFLRDRAWPFLREVALFYEDFLYEGPDGLLHAAPAVSPENSPVVEGGAKVDVCVDPTMEIALVRELLNHALAAAAELGIDDAQTARWRAMLAKLPPYGTNERGALREWLDPRFGDNDHHRHLSHLYPLFPGREIAPHRDAALFAAAKKATEARLATGLPDQTGWSLAHMACVWARLGEGDRALGCLEQLLRCCTGPNLFTRHNDWRGMGVTLEMLHGTTPPIQLDAAYGFSAAVQEMLLGIDESSLRILPALPAAWERGSMKGLRAPGGVKVDISWGNGEWQAAISLDRDFPARGIDVYTPGSPEPRRVDLKPGDVVRLFGLLK